MATLYIGGQSGNDTSENQGVDLLWTGLTVSQYKRMEHANVLWQNLDERRLC